LKKIKVFSLYRINNKSLLFFNDKESKKMKRQEELESFIFQNEAEEFKHAFLEEDRDDVVGRVVEKIVFGVDSVACTCGKIVVLYVNDSGHKTVWKHNIFRHVLICKEENPKVFTLLKPM